MASAAARRTSGWGAAGSAPDTVDRIQRRVEAIASLRQASDGSSVSPVQPQATKAVAAMLAGLGHGARPKPLGACDAPGSPRAWRRLRRRRADRQRRASAEQGTGKHGQRAERTAPALPREQRCRFAASEHDATPVPEDTMAKAEESSGTPSQPTRRQSHNRALDDAPRTCLRTAPACGRNRHATATASSSCSSDNHGAMAARAGQCRTASGTATRRQSGSLSTYSQRNLVGATSVATGLTARTHRD